MIDAVRHCLKDALALDAAAVSAVDEATTAADIAGWTSVSHLSLVLALEERFGVQFANDEIVRLGSVSAILQALRSKGVDGEG